MKNLFRFYLKIVVISCTVALTIFLFYQVRRLASVELRYDYNIDYIKVKTIAIIVFVAIAYLIGGYLNLKYPQLAIPIYFVILLVLFVFSNRFFHFTIEHDFIFARYILVAFPLSILSFIISKLDPKEIYLEENIENKLIFYEAR